MKIKIIEGSYVPLKDYKIAIVASRFNDFIVSKLIEGAVDTLKRHDIKNENITIIKVPGAFEIPIITQNIAKKEYIDGIIALGAIIRGATPHFDFVANECTKGLAQVSLKTNKPIGFGVLTVDSLEQAIERSGTKAGNKGSESAMTVLETLNIINNINP